MLAISIGHAFDRSDPGQPIALELCRGHAVLVVGQELADDYLRVRRSETITKRAACLGGIIAVMCSVVFAGTRYRISGAIDGIDNS